MKQRPLKPSCSSDSASSTKRLPSWLHQKLPRGKTLLHTKTILTKYHLSTVCEEAKCPNRLECFSSKTATFLALGKTCTRSCRFCDIAFAKTPSPPNPQEPKQIALATKELSLKHVVITMVTRDDLEDQGAEHMARIAYAIHKENPQTTIEVLTSDFSGKTHLIDQLLKAPIDIFNHNIETVERLSPKIRHKSTYQRSLSVLSYVKSTAKVPFIKSGIMVGLGENEEEVYQTIKDLYRAGCDIITIGQYLQPSHHQIKVHSFISPQQFKKYETYGYSLGIKSIHSGPFVRSSYHAAHLHKKMQKILPSN